MNIKDLFEAKIKKPAAAVASKGPEYYSDKANKANKASEEAEKATVLYKSQKSLPSFEVALASVYPKKIKAAALHHRAYVLHDNARGFHEAGNKEKALFHKNKASYHRNQRDIFQTPGRSHED